MILYVVASVWVFGWLLFFIGGYAVERWQGRHARREAHRRRVRMQRPGWWLEDES